MRYLPKSQSDRETMLREIGAKSIDDLFAAIPAEYRLKGDLNIPRQYAESEIVEFFRERAAEQRARLRHLSRRRRLLALPAGRHRLADLARRVLHRLHAVPAGDRAGHAAVDLRVPDHDLRADRHGRGQRLDVRRLDRRGRSADDGRARHRHAASALVATTVHPEYREVITTYSRYQGMPISTCRLRQERPRRSRRRSTWRSTTKPPACSSSRPTSSAPSKTSPRSPTSCTRKARC